MINNSRAAIQKKPRDINKKHPGKTYLPRFLDDSSIENLKSSVDRELADISMYMEQERQIVSKIIPGSVFQGQWDACSDKYPEAEEDSTWDVIVSCGKSHVFDNKTWEAGQQLIYIKNANKFVQRTNPGTDGIKQIISELKVDIENAEASIAQNKLAVADLNFALSSFKTEINAKVNENTANITTTNQTVADLTSTVATNKTELQASINGVKNIVDDNKIAGDLADAENNKLIIAADAKIDITNSTVADLSKTVSTNKLEMDSNFKAVNDRVDGTTAEIAKTNAQLAITNQTVADLEGSVATNVTELRAEYKAGDAKVASDASAALSVTNKTVADLEKTVATNMTTLRSEFASADSAVASKAAADLAITNQTVADNKQAAASATTALKSEMDGKVAAINSQMSTVSNKVGNLEAKWTVQADVNGKISGIEMVNNGRQSNFTIQTDRFVVTDGTTTKPPFSIEGGKVAMKDAVVSGKVQADAGEFRNVTIHESCTYLGTLNVDKLEGDVIKIFPVSGNVTIPATSKNRKVILSGLSFSARGSSPSNTGWARLTVTLNGQSASFSTPPNGIISSMIISKSCSYTWNLPANQTGSFSYSFSSSQCQASETYVESAGAHLMVFNAN